MSYIKQFSREYTVQYADICLRMGEPELNKHVPLIKDTFWFPENGNEVLCQEENAWQTFIAEVEQRYIGASDQKKFIQAFNRYGKSYVATAQQIGSLQLSGVSNDQLIDHYEQYFKIWNLYTAYLWVSFIFNDILAAKGQTILTEKNISAKAAAALLSPSKKSGILKLQEELSRFKQKGDEKLPSAEVKNILQEYSWMPCLDLQNDPWTKDHVQSFYDQLVVIEKPATTFTAAAKEAKLTPAEKILFRRIKELSYVKDVRDIYRRQGVHAILPFFDELGRRFRLSRKEAAYFTHDEIISALQGAQTLSAEESSARRKAFLMYWQDNKITVSTDPQKIAKFKQRFVQQEQQEIKGIIASRGIVQGEVKIIRGVQDLQKVKAGDILVAITTHPDYVPAMQRAAAFITDEGGLTSHAAIVAREMKKPCIVGTKNATQILKDGDMVEVDANEGIVRLLKKKDHAS